MTNIAQDCQCASVYDFDKRTTRWFWTPTYHVFEMYKVHQDATIFFGTEL